MLSTFLSFDLVNRDIQKSLNQVAARSSVVNDTAYYRDNIGKVTSVDEFLDDYRLYSYAMKAHGLEDMIYARAFMKQVLESDLSDENSFANRLADERYSNIAAAFNFGGSSATATAQSEGQMDTLFDTYDRTAAAFHDNSEEESRYFKVMLGEGHVTSVDGLLRNDRLREFVFTSYGYDGTYFNYTALRGVLTSDPEDSDSYYNQAYGNRLAAYRSAVTENAELTERAALPDTISAYEASITLGGEALPQIEALRAEKQQLLDDGGDAETLQPEIDALSEQIAAVQAAIEADTASRDEAQARLDELNARLVPVEGTDARRSELSAILATYSNAELKYLQFTEALSRDFNFNADGSVAAGGAIGDEALEKLLAGWFDAQPRTTRGEAVFNQEYFEKRIATATSVTDLTEDDRVLEYIKVAFGLDKAYIVRSTIEQILTNSGNIVEDYLDTRPQYKALYEAFNFDSAGNAAAGTALSEASLVQVRTNYMSRWDDAAEESYEKSVKNYKSDIAAIKTVADLFNDSASATLQFALSAVGIEAGEYSAFKLKKALVSDLSDPKSYIHTLKDERLVSLAKMFNFDSDGNIAAPVQAQSSSTIATIAKDYILRETRHLSGPALEAAREKAEKEAKYYTDAMQRLDSRDALLADRKLLDILLVSQGLDPAGFTDAELKKAFLSDVSDPESHVNTLSDKRLAQLVGTFRFDAKGELDRSSAKAVQNGGEIAATEQLYLRQLLETEKGEDNAGVRLALYFQRMADSITDPYVILGDDALLEFFRIAFSLPEEIANMDVDDQAKVVRDKLDLADLSDPEKLNALIERFTFLYDIENGFETPSPVSILTGSSAGGVSADTLWALAQLQLK